MSFITIDPAVAGDTFVAGTTDLADATPMTVVAIGIQTVSTSPTSGFWSATFTNPLPGAVGIYATDGVATYSANHILVKHIAPVVNGPIDPSSTIIGGTLTPSSVAPTGTQIVVSKNGTPFTTAAVDENGSWGVPVAGLVNGDVITAHAGGNENNLRTPTFWSTCWGLIAGTPNGGFFISGGVKNLGNARIVPDVSVFFPDSGGFFVAANTAPQSLLNGTLSPLSTGDVVATVGALSGPGANGSRIPTSLAEFGILWQLFGTQSLAYYRESHFAFVLPGDQVFLVGGRAAADPAFSVEDGTGDVTGETIGGAVTGNTLSFNRVGGYAVLLASGKIIIGGSDNTADIYDPGTNLFTPSAGTMTVGRSNSAAALLVSNKVLIAGGVSDSTAELYDPVGDSFAATTGPMAAARSNFVAILLNNNKVLCAGGDDGAGNALSAAELYDPVSDTFSATGSMNIPRRGYAAVKLADGKVLIVGGATAASPPDPTATAEIYDPVAETFTLTSGTALSDDSNSVVVAPVDPVPASDPPFPPGAAWAYGNKPL